MTGESRHRRLEALFLACLEVPPERRAAVLGERCPDDVALREEVLDLLRRDDSAPVGTSFAPPARELGPYRLERSLGEGGFGEVYAARQDTPVRRRVAIKILKPGMDSRAVLARFEAERQALARMDHPGIATVHDAGTTGEGRPYFVMELVDGEPITDFCDRRRFGVPARLELFVALCRAVQHAHQKGVIHRDLKPSNVLVTEVDRQPRPKVIDFGIAKAVHDPLGAGESNTLPGEILGTPEYMSPEQSASRGADVDTRSDVYSLGVMLYRLLTGRLPFASERLRASGAAELERILRDEDPPRPSDAAQLPEVPSRELRGELDWIVSCALAKDRERRYASAAALADDVGRHLRHEPVGVGPPTAMYRLAKLAHRHRAFVAGALAVVAALLAGLAATTTQVVRASRAEADARREADVSGSVNEFLARMLAAGNPVLEPRGREVTVREIVDLAAGELEEAPPDSREVEAAVHHTLGATYAGIGSYDEADRHLSRADSLWSDRSSTRALETRMKIAELDALRGRAGAAELVLDGLAAAVASTGAEDSELRARYLALRGGVLGELARYDEADSCLEAVVHLRRPAAGARLGVALQDLAELRKRRGHLAGADSLAREALAVARASHAGDHFDVASASVRLASIRAALGDAAEAEALDREAVAMGERVLGPEHPLLAEWREAHGQALTKLGRLVESEAELRRALAILGRTEPEPGMHTASVLGDLADVLQQRGAAEQALPLRLDVLAIQRRTQGERHERVATAWNNLGSTYRILGRYREAEDAFVAALALFREILGDEHPTVFVATYNLGKTRLDDDRAAEAEETLRGALALGEGVLPAGHPNLAICRAAHGRALAALGRREEAKRALREGVEGLTAALGAEHPRTREAADELARLEAIR